MRMWKPPRIFLGTTKRIGDVDVSVTKIELEHGVSAGIHLRSFVEGLIPFQEEHEARLERGIRLIEWESMPYMEKVLIVATRRVRRAMQNLQQEAEIDNMERKNRRLTKGKHR